MKTVQEIQEDLRQIAVRKALAENLAFREEDVSVTLKIRGHGVRKEKRTAEISTDDWQSILSLEGPANVRRLYERLHEKENKPLQGSVVKSLGISLVGYPLFKSVNAPFVKANLPFIFGPVFVVKKETREYEGFYQMYKKIDKKL